MKPSDERLQQLRDWLKENVFAPDTPKTITISKIKFSWRELRGSFQLSLDSQPIEERFDLSIDIAGRIKFTPPMFCSPFGVPCSYSAIALNDQTHTALTKALESIFPKIRGYGQYRELGLEVGCDTPLKRRVIDPIKFAEQRALIRKSSFKYTAEVGQS